MEMHDALVALFATATRGHVKEPIDPLLFRALVLAIEGLTRVVVEAGDEGRKVSNESLDRARGVMLQLVRSALELT